MGLSPGTKLGPYEITSSVGKGGMGEVYSARDTRLDRPVAIKVLPSTVSADRDRLRRFEQEAKAASQLNHPNILSVYDVGQHNGSPYLVTELLEGETLRQRLARDRLSLPRAIEIALQIARGLAAAHDHGIVHRDLKPENIYATRQGHLKILDFGLAKLARADDTPMGDCATLTAGTSVGTLLGTVGYMSPEQARGQRVDHRADIFSFGAILYEMVSGIRAFKRETPADTITAILKDHPPPLSEIDSHVPPALERVMLHCLEKNRDERFHSMHDVIFDLEGITITSVTKASAHASAFYLRKVGLVAAAVLATAALLAYVGLRRMTPLPAAPARAISFQRLTDFVGMEEAPAISPDGKSVALSSGAMPHIWVRLLAGGPPLKITRDEVPHLYPRWSPDSASLIYFSSAQAPDAQGAIYEIPALGGMPRQLTNSISGGDISHDGKRLAFFRRDEGQVEFVIAERDGSNPRVLARLAPEYDYCCPRWSPDDRLLGYQRGNVFEHHIFAVSASGGEPHGITREWGKLTGYAWLPDGSGVVYSSSRGNTLLYLPTMNLWSVKLKGGGPRPLTFGEASYTQPDVDSRGHLVATRIRREFNIWKFPIDGSPAENVRRAIQVTSQTGQVQTPSVSPGERELVYLSDAGGHGNLWVIKLDGSAEVRQITFEQDPDVAIGVPVWSPDGQNIAFFSRHPQTPYGGYWLVKPDGSKRRRLVEDGGWAAWAPDGKWLYVTPGTQEGEMPKIVKVPANGGNAVAVRTDGALGSAPSPNGQTLYFIRHTGRVGGGQNWEIHAATPENGPSQLLARIPAQRTPAFHLVQPVVSPDGAWLALMLADGFATNLYLLPTKGGPLRQVTDFGKPTDIARRVSWSSNSKHIYAAVGYVDADVVLFTNLLP